MPEKSNGFYEMPNPEGMRLEKNASAFFECEGRQ